LLVRIVGWVLLGLLAGTIAAKPAEAFEPETATRAETTDKEEA
jgi:hypothetical protein